jgi:spoIIIJ-associated protein
VTPEPVTPEPVTPEPVTAEPVTAEPGAAVGEPPPAASRAEPAGDDELLAAAERSAGILLRFAGIEANAAARPGPERIDVEISGGDHDVLLVEGGRGLLAIQHLLPRMLRGLAGRSSYVRVDSGGFHQKRRERLEGLARREAETARKQGKARSLPPMAPDERRIIHMALNDDPTVITESRGAGLRKRVVIRPAAGERGDELEPPRG